MAANSDSNQRPSLPYSQSYRSQSTKDAVSELAPSARPLSTQYGSSLNGAATAVVPTSKTTSNSTEEPGLLHKPAVHRLNATGSVQAIAVDGDVLFAGLQGGDIVAWSLDTYEQIARVHAHFQSVLGLSLSEDKSLLFSTGVDSVVNVWSTRSLQRRYSLHSHDEVGDIFCVAYSSRLKTLFCGSQNASIQWQEIRGGGEATPSAESSYDAERKHRFFDSLGPGGIPSPRPQTYVSNGILPVRNGQSFTMPAKTYLPYAHKSYVYAMILAKGLVEEDPDQEVLVSAGGGGTIKMWSIGCLREDGLKVLHKFKNEGASVLSLAYKAPFLHAGLTDGVTLIYDLASLQLVQKLHIGLGDITQIQIIGNEALCGTSEGWVKRSSNRFTEVERWPAHDGKILATAISKSEDHTFLVTGGNDNTIAFWDVARKGAPTRRGTRSNNELLSSLRQFVAYRTVPNNPHCVSDCHEAATFLRKLFNAFGATTSLVSPKEDVNPILLAKFRASKPTVRTKTLLFYGHYDVVDAETGTSNGQSKWHADPFTLHPLNGYLYGRGVTDDKGPILAALYAVGDLVQNNALTCNIVFLLEGDEEAGSRGFRSTVRKLKEEIGEVDYILLSNSYWLDDHVPCLTFGMRGVVHAGISVISNKATDLHSGMDGKALQHEPLKDLTVLMANLIGLSGTEVTIPNFYDSVDSLQPSELRAYKSVASALIAGHPEIKNEDAFIQSLMQRWREPNLTVHSITVPESKTAVTISHRAKATISIRIVPSQTADEIASSLEKFLHKQFERLKSRNQLEVQITAKADPWLGKVHSEIYEELREAIIEAWSYDNSENNRAFEDANDTLSPQADESNLASASMSRRRASALASTGTFTPESTPNEPLFIREGGSIPAINFLEREFDAPAAMFPMGQASDNAHLDNERIRVENLYKGRDVLRMLFARLGKRETLPLGHRLRGSASVATI